MSALRRVGGSGGRAQCSTRPGTWRRSRAAWARSAWAHSGRYPWPSSSCHPRPGRAMEAVGLGDFGAGTGAPVREQPPFGSRKARARLSGSGGSPVQAGGPLDWWVAERAAANEGTLTKLRHRSARLGLRRRRRRRRAAAFLALELLLRSRLPRLHQRGNLLGRLGRRVLRLVRLLLHGGLRRRLRQLGRGGSLLLGALGRRRRQLRRCIGGVQGAKGVREGCGRVREG